MTQVPENIKAILTESAYDLVMQNQQTDLYYQQLEQDYNKLFANIQNRLGKNNRKLMLKLEAMQNEMAGIDEELIYWQGMIDGAALLRAIKLI